MAMTRTGTARPVEPIGIFTYGALRAGWFYLWRLTLFTLPYWGGAAAIAAGLIHVDPSLTPIAAILVGLGALAAFIASIPLTNRIARTWALAWFGRRMTGGVWWGMFWRVLIVSLIAGVIFTAVQIATTVYAATMEWSPMQMFITMVPYAVLIANLVVTVRAYGWAMSVMVAKRLAAAGAAAPARVPAARRPASSAPPGAPRATADVAAGACPKCGGRDVEQGAVIGRYCRVCGWRERT
jgi:hypothetical protein